MTYIKTADTLYKSYKATSDTLDVKIKSQYSDIDGITTDEQITNKATDDGFLITTSSFVINEIIRLKNLIKQKNQDMQNKNEYDTRATIVEIYLNYYLKNNYTKYNASDIVNIYNDKFIQRGINNFSDLVSEVETKLNKNY